MKWFPPAAVTTLLACGLAVGAPAPALATTQCTRTLAAGEHTLPVTYAGQRYEVTVYLPTGARASGRLPAIVNLHGTQGTGSGQVQYSAMKPAADAGRYVVVAPSGTIPAGSGFAWNVPGVGAPPAGARDDVGFLDQVITTATTTLCLDPARVYGTGYSGGGRMMSAFACHRPARIAAIAPVAGLRAGRPDPLDAGRPDPAACAPGRAVPVVTFHGLQDTKNPYLGGGSAYWGYPVPVALERWAQVNSCRGGSRTAAVSTHVSRVSYRNCHRAAEAVLYTISDGGHTWPGTPVDNGNGHVTQEIDANRLMWRFFQRFRLPRT
jgi:polyhydroxybutyrate depolymerase